MLSLIYVHPAILALLSIQDDFLFLFIAQQLVLERRLSLLIIPERATARCQKLLVVIDCIHIRRSGIDHDLRLLRRFLILIR